MKNTPESVLLRSFLFDGIDKKEAVEVIKQLTIEEVAYSKADVIFSPHKYERKIGFVTNGECLISRPSSGQPIPINIAKSGDSFGITTVFSDSSEFPTLITAKSLCSVFFINSDELTKIMELNSAIAFNVIRFLTRRIEFLNDRIAAFSASSVEEKLVNYILTLHKRFEASEFEFNKKQSAEAINCGRASLYRAMESLAERGYVKFDNKKIYIIDLTGLERMLT